MFKNLALHQNTSIFVQNMRFNAHKITITYQYPLLKTIYHGQFNTQ